MNKVLAFLIILCFGTGFCEAARSQKPRIIVLTDIENEPDDAMSFVRFLVYSNQWDVEGLLPQLPYTRGGRLQNGACLRFLTRMKKCSQIC